MKLSKGNVLKYIKENDCVTFPQLQQEFGCSYVAMRKVVDALVNDNAIFYNGGITYGYKYAETNAAAAKSGQDGEATDLDNSFSGFISRMYARAERKTRVFEEYGDNSTGLFSSDEDDGDADDKNPNNRLILISKRLRGARIINALKCGIPTREDADNYKIPLDICYSNDKQYQIKLQYGKKFPSSDWYFTDSGLTLEYAAEYKGFGKEGAELKLKSIMEKYGLVLDGGELCKDIENPAEALNILINFVFAIEDAVNKFNKCDSYLFDLEAYDCYEKIKAELSGDSEITKEAFIKKLNDGLDPSILGRPQKDELVKLRILSGLEECTEAEFEELKKKLINS